MCAALGLVKLNPRFALFEFQISPFMKGSEKAITCSR